MVIYLATYFLILGIIVLLGFFLQSRKVEKYITNEPNEDTISLDKLVVIIPFRNEEARILGLLESIKKSTKLPSEILFVDDHSNDKGIGLIETVLKGVNYRILKLPVGIEGKKRAIRFALENSNSDYILSLDADVEFDPEYFSNLSRLKGSDLYILPAILRAKTWYEYLFELDVVLINALNCGLAGLKRPIIASGANLLYKRSSFEKYDRFESHVHMPSGDDIYLLRDFRNSNAETRLIAQTTLAVYTETPKSLKEMIHQRLRWIAKTGDVKDQLSNVLAVIQVLITFSFVAIMIYLAIIAEWRLFFGFYLLKTAADMILFLPFFNRTKRMKTWLFIPIYELIFPIYSLVILILMFWFKPVWKGRTINSNSNSDSYRA